VHKRTACLDLCIIFIASFLGVSEPGHKLLYINILPIEHIQYKKSLKYIYTYTVEGTVIIIIIGDRRVESNYIPEGRAVPKGVVKQCLTRKTEYNVGDQ